MLNSGARTAPQNVLGGGRSGMAWRAGEGRKGCVHICMCSADHGRRYSELDWRVELWLGDREYVPLSMQEHPEL